MNDIILMALMILGALGAAGLLIGLFSFGNQFLRINRYRSQKEVVVAKAEAEATQIQADMRLHGLREARQKQLEVAANGKMIEDGPNAPQMPVDWVEAVEKLKPKEGDVETTWDPPEAKYACPKCGSTYIFEPSVSSHHGRMLGRCNKRVEDHEPGTVDTGKVKRCFTPVEEIEAAEAVPLP